MAKWAAGAWVELDGMLLMSGVDLFELPMSRAFHVIRFVRFQHADEKERYKIQAEWDRPVSLPREVKRRERDDFWSTSDTDGQLFMAAMSQSRQTLGGG